MDESIIWITHCLGAVRLGIIFLRGLKNCFTVLKAGKKNYIENMKIQFAKKPQIHKIKTAHLNLLTYWISHRGIVDYQNENLKDSKFLNSFESVLCCIDLKCNFLVLSKELIYKIDFFYNLFSSLFPHTGCYIGLFSIILNRAF